jgi:hypothetical protein
MICSFSLDLPIFFLPSVGHMSTTGEEKNTVLLVVSFVSANPLFLEVIVDSYTITDSF